MPTLHISDRSVGKGNTYSIKICNYYCYQVGCPLRKSFSTTSLLESEHLINPEKAPFQNADEKLHVRIFTFCEYKLY